MSKVISIESSVEEFDHRKKHLVSPKLLLERHGIRYTTIRTWRRNGCPRLNGKKPTTFPVKRGNRICEFFDEAEMVNVSDFNGGTPSDKFIDDEVAYSEFGFVGSFLWRYSTRDKHPALRRFIRKGKARTVSAGRTRNRKTYFRQDLVDIRAWMTNGVNGSHLTTSQAIDAGIEAGRLKHLRRSERIRATQKVVRNRAGQPRNGFTHDMHDVARELKIVSDAISNGRYGVYVDGDGVTWRSRSNASSTYSIPAVTLDGYANGGGPHGLLRVKDVPILMNGNRRQSDYIKMQPGLNDDDLQRIADSRKTYGKLPVLRRDGYDWFPPVAAAVFTGVSRRKLFEKNELLGAKEFEVQADPWKGKVWHYRKDKMIEHFPGTADANSHGGQHAEIMGELKGARGDISNAKEVIGGKVDAGFAQTQVMIESSAAKANRQSDERGKPLTEVEVQRRKKIVDGWERAKGSCTMEKYCSDLVPPIGVKKFRGYQSSLCMKSKRQNPLANKPPHK